MSLHAIDLQIAEQYLDELDRRAYPRNGGDITCQALWHSALVLAYKCFGWSCARSSLNADAKIGRGVGALTGVQLGGG